MDTLCGDKRNTEYEEVLKKRGSFFGELKFRSASSSCLFSSSWKNVFCAIHQGRLYVYKSDLATPPNKVFNLRAMEVYENHQIPHSFELKSAGDDCQFVASSEASKQSWIEALNSNKKNQQCADDSDYEIPDNFDHLEVEKLNASTWSGTSRNQYKTFEQSTSTRTHVGHSSLKHHQAFTSFPRFNSQSNPGKSKFENAIWSGEAEKARRILLYIKSNGTFMIRNSSTCDPYLKTLLVMHNGKILKYPMSMSKQGKCLISGQEFRSGDELIEHFTKNCLTGYPVKLTHPYYDAPVRDKF